MFKLLQHKKFLAGLGLIASSALLTSIAQATTVAIDTFSVTRNGALFFEDTFDNGDPYDTNWVFNNGNSGTYATTPSTLAGPESNGRLYIDPYAGAIVNSSLNGNQIYLQQATLITNTSNSATNLGRGLKDDDTFSVNGVFDLIAPTVVGERFGVRLTDRNSPNGTADDVVEVDVRLRNSGLFVEFREQNVATSSHVVMDLMELSAASIGLTDNEFAMYDQIALVLDRTTNTSDITGRFSLMSSQGLIANYDYNFGGSSTIFEGERFTRAEFIAVAPVPASEPTTFLLFGAGLVGLYARRRRKT